MGGQGGIATNHEVVHVNRNAPTAMRSPHEVLGHFALESAMDELAYATGVEEGWSQDGTVGLRAGASALAGIRA